MVFARCRVSLSGSSAVTCQPALLHGIGKSARTRTNIQQAAGGKACLPAQERAFLPQGPFTNEMVKTVDEPLLCVGMRYVGVRTVIMTDGGRIRDILGKTQAATSAFPYIEKLVRNGKVFCRQYLPYGSGAATGTNRIMYNSHCAGKLLWAGGTVYADGLLVAGTAPFKIGSKQVKEQHHQRNGCNDDRIYPPGFSFFMYVVAQQLRHLVIRLFLVANQDEIWRTSGRITRSAVTYVKYSKGAG